jgi:hypothetical protein
MCLVKACIVFEVSAGFEKDFQFSILNYFKNRPLLFVFEVIYYTVVQSTNYANLFSEFW